jgi:hypothetical protein
VLRAERDMETSLHRQLKEHYAVGEATLEAPLDGYRIDVLTADQAVEIQHGSLAAIRDKIARLVKKHRVVVVKPIVVRKRLVRQDAKSGHVLGRRLSPKKGVVWDVFHELVYFTRVFPNKNLILDVPLVDIEEWRYPGHGRRRRWRRNDFQIEDQKLTHVHETHRFRSGRDLANLIPPGLPVPFHTGHLAEHLGLPRWIAQRIAYCFREMRIAEDMGKAGNARLYCLPAQRAQRLNRRTAA